MSKAKLAFSYCRMSTTEQIKGDSLRRQKEWSEAWCQAHSVPLASLKLQDLGVSAYKGKNAKAGALGLFLAAVDAGKVPPNSVLLVESLDRLSRNEISEALELFLGILRNGIKIVTRLPEMEFTKSSINDVGNILIAIVSMSRAHEESALKAQRLADSWKAKRAKVGTKKLTSRCPAWLSLSADRESFDIIGEKADTVRQIFAWIIEGYGIGSIARMLNRNEVPPIADVPLWHSSYVSKISHNRAVMGEFTPRHGRGGTCIAKRPQAGETIADYYPQIVSEADFYRAQQGIEGRAGQRGPIGKDRVANLFTGLIHDARDGSALNLVHKGSKSNGLQLVSASARLGVTGSTYIAFTYNAFESVVLTTLRELDVEDSETAGDELKDKLDAAIGKLKDVDAKIKKTKSRLIEEDDFDALADVLRQLEAKRNELIGTIETLKGEIESRETDTLGEAKGLLQRLDVCEDKSELFQIRTRLKSHIRQLVDRIDMLVVKHGHWRVAVVQLHLANGRHRLAIVTTHRGEWMHSSALQAGHGFTEQAFDITHPGAQEHFQELLDGCTAKAVSARNKQILEALTMRSVYEQLPEMREAIAVK